MLLHNIADSLIPQTDEPQLIAGKYVPPGYLNGTLICNTHNEREKEIALKEGRKPINKKINSFTKSQANGLFIKELDDKLKRDGVGADWSQPLELMKNNEELAKSYQEFIDSPTSVIEIKVSKGVSNYERGTWVHPILAVEIAGYCSPKFKILANELFLKVVHPDFNPDDPHFKKLRSLGKEQWDRVRVAGKIARRKFTDCLMIHLIDTKGYEFYKSPEGNDEFRKYTGISQSKLTGIPNFNGNRNNCTEHQLNVLEYFESRFEALFDGCYPDVLTFDEIFDKVIQKTKNKFNL